MSYTPEFLAMEQRFRAQAADQISQAQKYNTALRVIRLEEQSAALDHALNVAQAELRLCGMRKAANEVARLHSEALAKGRP